MQEPEACNGCHPSVGQKLVKSIQNAIEFMRKTERLEAHDIDLTVVIVTNCSVLSCNGDPDF